jgi:YspA, cpYpsA-related SLOG family
MRVLVCGSRHFNDPELMEDVLKQWNISTIIEGEARGADRLARDYGERHNIHVLRFPALWGQYGKSAGPIRNAQMLAEGRPDLVVAFPLKDSRGTFNMIAQAKMAGVEVYVVECE